jgi:pimeloyl-ACP methyl ester carboxylesterase
MTVARPLVKAHYANPGSHTYFVGCSTGGREAMMAAERYPEKFDGIVVGSPAMRTSYSNLATAWVTTSLNAVAPKGSQWRPNTALALSASDRRLVVDTLLKACNGLEGARGGMVFDTMHCDFDPQALVCRGEKTDTCLAPGQVQAIKKAFSGPKPASGRQVYPGLPYDTGIAATGRGIPGLLSGGMSPVGPSPTGVTMDVDLQGASLHDAREMAGDSNA